MALARIFCTLFVGLLAYPARATDISEGLAADSVSSWTEADGRPLGSVYAIAQALDGFWWPPLPRHLLQGVAPAELSRHAFNRRPVGSGAGSIVVMFNR